MKTCGEREVFVGSTAGSFMLPIREKVQHGLKRVLKIYDAGYLKRFKTLLTYDC